MKSLVTHDNNKVAIAIGKENGKWYVQTTDIEDNTYLSESIIEDLPSREQALEVANEYAKEYGMDIVEWNK